MSVAAEVLASVRTGKLRRRDAMYTLACALPPSEERNALLALLAEADVREAVRIKRAQAEIDLIPTRAKRAA